MSQDILRAGWSDEFVEKHCSHNPERGRKAAKAAQERVRHAMSVLDDSDIGEEVAFKGSCPSGETFSNFFRWNGSPDQREAIAVKARLATAGSAWSAWLVKVSECGEEVLKAKMRTD